MMVCVWTAGRIANANAGANGDVNKVNASLFYCKSLIRTETIIFGKEFIIKCITL